MLSPTDAVTAFFAAAACADLPPAAVAALPAGWFLHVAPGEHPAVTGAPLLAFLPYDDARIDTADSTGFRACIVGGDVLRFYTPGRWT